MKREDDIVREALIEIGGLTGLLASGDPADRARMELRVAVEEWLRAMPEFQIADASGVSWAGGQVRGPRTVPVVVG